VSLDNVFVAGFGTTSVGKWYDRRLRDLASEALISALDDSGVSPSEVDVVFFANAVGGFLTGQEMVRGQVSLNDAGLMGCPVINIENACASGSSAASLAAYSIASGQYRCAVALGAEKLASPDRALTFGSIGAAIDVNDRGIEGVISGHSEQSPFMAIYAAEASAFLSERGATQAHLARIAVKNRRHAGSSSRAQYRSPLSIDQVLNARVVAHPFTLPMCSPVSDGAAAIVFVAGEVARRGNRKLPQLLSSEVRSGVGGLAGSVVSRAAIAAFEVSGVDPSDVDVVEVHDATASAELIAYEDLGLCRPGDAVALLESSATELGGRLPVNTGGGLLSRGHPIGATGCYQLAELCEQLRNRAGPRQVEGARVGLAQNAGGHLGPGPATATVTILSI